VWSSTKDIYPRQPLELEEVGLETYVLSDTHSGTSAKCEQVPVHRLPLFLAHEPPLRLEVICVLAENLLIVVNDRWVHSNAIAFGYELSRRLEALFWRVSLHAQSHAWVHAHSLFDRRADIWQLRCAFRVFDRRTQGTGGKCSIDLGMGFRKLLGVLHKVVEGGTESDGGRVGAGEPENVVNDSWSRRYGLLTWRHRLPMWLRGS
jgi:hypothetical protein